MNKTLAEEELDRELVVRHNQFISGKNKEYVSDYITKAKITPKTFSLSENSRDGSMVQFQKSSGSSENELEITLKWNEKKTEKCSLGHDHEVSKKDREYKFFRMSWEHVDVFIEWLKNGSWSEVKTGQPQFKVIARETLGLLALIEQCGDLKIAKPHITKFKTKLNDIIRFEPKNNN